MWPRGSGDLYALGVLSGVLMGGATKFARKTVRLR